LGQRGLRLSGFALRHRRVEPERAQPRVERGVVLRRLVPLADGGVDLDEAARLMGRAARDVLDDAVEPAGVRLSGAARRAASARIIQRLVVFG
jgi:hypothetical protein